MYKLKAGEIIDFVLDIKHPNQPATMHTMQCLQSKDKRKARGYLKYGYSDGDCIANVSDTKQSLNWCFK